ncbi:hypothetical protein BN946_scf185008.g100 [Trametes cinnabarina]|uniref:Uncharacterized protein n=1 Tax=Pycnoporus cinnabarinus TaxID=5643 RepID=A0A060SFS7_PYCCI|nr:hypothetical protein BN946_scf185008.g100 [Trametes cinnabarina]
MTGTLALMPQVPPTGLPCEFQELRKPSIRSNIQTRPAGPRQRRTQSDLNDIRLRRVSAAVACSPSKHSQETPHVLPKPRRPPTRVTSAPSSIALSSTADSSPLAPPDQAPSFVMTATMTLPSPAQMRVSTSTPQFLIQQTHGPPTYFLHRFPSIPVDSNSSTLQLKQKRSFKAAMRSPPPLPTSPVMPTLPSAEVGRSSETADATADATATPVMPLNHPTRPTLDSSDPLQPVEVLASRPVSQDAEETIRQLEQLAAELKQMGPGVLAATKQRRSRVPSQRRRRDVLSKSAGAAYASKGILPNRRLSVPRIVVTNPSSENLVAEPECDTPGVGTPDSDGGSGDVTEEELWVEAYGGWGMSEKGKWKASDFDEDEDEDFHDSTSASNMHVPRQERPATSIAAESEQAFYIYESIGAPEFLVGSSTSLVARATTGFHSRRQAASAKNRSATVRRRRRRPTALVLATPEQAEWFADIVLGSAPPAVPRLPQTPKHYERPSTAPGHGMSPQSLPPPSPPPLTPRRAMSSDVSDPFHAISPLVPSTNTVHDRRSEPFDVAIPRASSTYETSAQGRQAPSWMSLARKDVPAPSSEPNSPRPGARPRLKSIKGLFKHFSK